MRGGAGRELQPPNSNPFPAFLLPSGNRVVRQRAEDCRVGKELAACDGSEYGKRRALLLWTP